MLKIKSQLNRALVYQSVLGAERVMGHFDDSAKDLAGPPASSSYRESWKERKPTSSRTIVTRMRARKDPVTGSWVGYYDEKSE
jgi:hypothetical protein